MFSTALHYGTWIYSTSSVGHDSFTVSLLGNPIDAGKLAHRSTILLFDSPKYALKCQSQVFNQITDTCCIMQCILTWRIKNILHYMDNTICCHQVTVWHVHRVDMNRAVYLGKTIYAVM